MARKSIESVIDKNISLVTQESQWTTGFDSMWRSFEQIQRKLKRAYCFPCPIWYIRRGRESLTREMRSFSLAVGESHLADNGAA